jgi:hypothetical protein
MVPFIPGRCTSIMQIVFVVFYNIDTVLAVIYYLTSNTFALEHFFK